MSTRMLIPLIRIDHCRCVLASFKELKLLGLTQSAGPYVLQAGKVPVGSFGFNYLGEPWEFVSVPGHMHQKAALYMAQLAFEYAVEEYPENDDPISIREAGRAAYRRALQECRDGAI